MCGKYTFVLTLLLITGCSSTLLYEATGYYVETSDGTVSRFDNESDCNAAAVDCIKIQLTWETERYCGFYASAEDAVSEKVMRVGTSGFAIMGWVLVDDETLLLGDDESFSGANVEEVLVNSDVLCGSFEPPRKLVDVREGEMLNLEISCKPILSGIQLMPASTDIYPLQVKVTGEEAFWLGCKK